jgi:hypothetical protein
VKWPPASEDVSPGAQERPRLNQLKVGVVINEMVVADAGVRSGIQREENVISWKPLLSNGY